jgi:hypothetical protein
MQKLINSKPVADWPPEVQALWDTLGLTGVSRANWFTARPDVDEYNRGSTREGFVYTIRVPGRFGPDVRMVEWKVPKPSAPYILPVHNRIPTEPYGELVMRRFLASKSLGD